MHNENTQPTETNLQNEVQNTKKRIPPVVKFLIKLGVIAVVVAVLLIFIIGIYPVRGTSNFPMLKDGDLTITQKIGRYSTGDVVSYMKNGKRYFSRIIAVGGDIVEITQDGLVVNGIEPAEEIFYATHDTSHVVQYPFQVPDESIFVLNDYRDDENDSRTFGAIHVSELDGKVIFVFRRRKI